MLLKSILYRVQLHHGFVYGSIRWLEQKKRPALEVEIRPRKNSRPVCSVCGIPGPGYDTLAPSGTPMRPRVSGPQRDAHATMRVGCKALKIQLVRSGVLR